jgi:hypothetical protein
MNFELGSWFFVLCRLSVVSCPQSILPVLNRGSLRTKRTTDYGPLTTDH